MDATLIRRYVLVLSVDAGEDELTYNTLNELHRDDRDRMAHGMVTAFGRGSVRGQRRNQTYPIVAVDDCGIVDKLRLFIAELNATAATTTLGARAMAQRLALILTSEGFEP